MWVYLHVPDVPGLQYGGPRVVGKRIDDGGGGRPGLGCCSLHSSWTGCPGNDMGDIGIIFWHMIIITPPPGPPCVQH